MISGVQHSDTSRSQVITSNKDNSTNFEVALSNSGTGKLSFSCNSADHPDFHMPDMESVCKEMEARCLRTYKIDQSRHARTLSANILGLDYASSVGHVHITIN